MTLQQRIAEGSRLRREYNAALARHDKPEAIKLRSQLEQYNSQWGHGDSGSASGSEVETKGLKREPSEPSLSGLKREGSGSMLSGGGFAVKREESAGEVSILEELSERNRQLNYENARRLQVLEAERRKKAVLDRVKREEEEKDAYVSLFLSLRDGRVDADSDFYRAANPAGTSWSKEQEMMEKNPELAGKDIGTKMAHMIEIELPDF